MRLAILFFWLVQAYIAVGEAQTAQSQLQPYTLRVLAPKVSPNQNTLNIAVALRFEITTGHKVQVPRAAELQPITCQFIRMTAPHDNLVIEVGEYTVQKPHHAGDYLSLRKTAGDFVTMVVSCYCAEGLNPDGSWRYHHEIRDTAVIISALNTIPGFEVIQQTNNR